MSESNNDTNENAQQEPEFLGYIARFEGPDALVEGCDQARRAGYHKMDAFSPFPVHGIDDAIGIKRTRLPLIVFCTGMTAMLIGLFLQWYTNTNTDSSPLFPGYPFKISGKAMFSLPANIPVTFEVIVLLSAFAAFFGMWIMNGLPKFSNPLFRHPEFRRATSDGFFLFICKGNGSFDESQTKDELQEWGAVSVDSIHDPKEELHVPGYFKLSGLIIASLMLVPPAIIYKAQYTKNHSPRMHFNPDMDRQFRGETQESTVVPDINPFGDNHVMRKDPAGTIARGELARLEDSEFYEGIKAGSENPQIALASFHKQEDGGGEATDSAGAIKEPDWITDFPSQVREQLSSKEKGVELFERGKQRFDIYCAVCHGYSGHGDGLVSRKGMALKTQGKSDWTPAKSLYDPTVLPQPVGRVFNTISYGRGGMGPYRSQITPEDRWAIVFFVKALQLSKSGEQFELPDGTRLESWDQVNPVQSSDGESETNSNEQEKSEDKSSDNEDQSEADNPTDEKSPSSESDQQVP